MALSAEDRVRRDELAQQFLHADLRGYLRSTDALILADVAMSWCRGRQPEPPADFGTTKQD